MVHHDCEDFYFMTHWTWQCPRHERLTLEEICLLSIDKERSPVDFKKLYSASNAAVIIKSCWINDGFFPTSSWETHQNCFLPHIISHRFLFHRAWFEEWHFPRMFRILFFCWRLLEARQRSNHLSELPFWSPLVFCKNYVLCSLNSGACNQVILSCLASYSSNSCCI